MSTWDGALRVSSLEAKLEREGWDVWMCAEEGKEEEEVHRCWGLGEGWGEMEGGYLLWRPQRSAAKKRRRRPGDFDIPDVYLTFSYALMIQRSLPFFEVSLTVRRAEYMSKLWVDDWESALESAADSGVEIKMRNSEEKQLYCFICVFVTDWVRGCRGCCFICLLVFESVSVAPSSVGPQHWLKFATISICEVTFFFWEQVKKNKFRLSSVLISFQ